MNPQFFESFNSLLQEVKGASTIEKFQYLTALCNQLSITIEVLPTGALSITDSSAEPTTYSILDEDGDQITAFPWWAGECYILEE